MVILSFFFFSSTNSYVLVIFSPPLHSALKSTFSKHIEPYYWSVDIKKKKIDHNMLLEEVFPQFYRIEISRINFSYKCTVSPEHHASTTMVHLHPVLSHSTHSLWLRDPLPDLHFLTVDLSALTGSSDSVVNWSEDHEFKSQVHQAATVGFFSKALDSDFLCFINEIDVRRFLLPLCHSTPFPNKWSLL